MPDCGGMREDSCDAKSQKEVMEMNSVTLVGRVVTVATGYTRTGGGEAMFMLETSGQDEGAGYHAIVLDAGLESRCTHIVHAGGMVRVEGVLCACPPGRVRARMVLGLYPAGGGDGQTAPATAASVGMWRQDGADGAVGGATDWVQ